MPYSITRLQLRARRLIDSCRAIGWGISFSVGILIGVDCSSASTNEFYSVLKSFGNPLLSGHEPVGELVERTNGLIYGTTRLGGSKAGGTIFRVEKDGSNYLVIHSFGNPNDGITPEAGLIQGTDGMLYGTTLSGGDSNLGCIFRIDPQGSNYSILRSFGSTPFDGSSPRAGLIEASDGRLYGTTQFGGISNAGTIFGIEKNGAGYNVIHSFGANSQDGKYPVAALIESHHGHLYGTASAGGTNNVGVLFSIEKGGNGFTIVRHFRNSALEAHTPNGKLVQTADGRLFGTTIGGIAGNVFRINTNGTGYAKISITDGRLPESGLVTASDGALYGTTDSGGLYNLGVLFRVTTNSLIREIVHDFAYGEGRGSKSPLLSSSDGKLYGSTCENSLSGVSGTIFSFDPNDNAFNTEYAFSRTGVDGAAPNSPLLHDNGWLFGTTHYGGSEGHGMIFKMKEDGTGFEIIKSFLPYGSSDGRSPSAGLSRMEDGKLYGTTSQGGSNNFGTVFRVNSDGSQYQILKHFQGGSNEVQIPFGKLVAGGTGAFLGTGAGLSNDGSIFRINPDGSGFAVLHVFPSYSADGRVPRGIIRASDDFFYGVTGVGGTADAGTVFRIDETGNSYTVIHNFPSNPQAGRGAHSLIEGSDGLLYGSTGLGGDYQYGTIFRMKRDGSDHTILKSFSDGPGQERGIETGLFEGPDGFIYAATRFGGVFNQGCIIRIAKDGTAYNKLVDLPFYLTRQFTIGTDHKLYAASTYGGEMDMGVIFKFFPPPELSIASLLPAGPVHLTLHGIPSQTYTVQATTNTLTWGVLTNVVTTANSTDVFDHFATNSRVKLYRAVWSPD